MQKICRIGQNFLNISFICVKCCPILFQKHVGNTRKCHVLESRICRKSHFWSSDISSKFVTFCRCVQLYCITILQLLFTLFVTLSYLARLCVSQLLLLSLSLSLPPPLSLSLLVLDEYLIATNCGESKGSILKYQAKTLRTFKVLTLAKFQTVSSLYFCIVQLASQLSVANTMHFIAILYTVFVY